MMLLSVALPEHVLLCTMGILCMQELTLTGNRLHGPVPHHFSALTSLQALRLANNSISGILGPIWAASWPSLTELLLAGNSLHGTLPAAWGSMHRLQVRPHNTVQLGRMHDTGGFRSSGVFKATLQHSTAPMKLLLHCLCSCAHRCWIYHVMISQVPFHPAGQAWSCCRWGRPLIGSLSNPHMPVYDVLPCAACAATETERACALLSHRRSCMWAATCCRGGLPNGMFQVGVGATSR